MRNLMSQWTDSNPRPADYKSAALPAELHWLFLLTILVKGQTILPLF